jgi:hypothetical protein
VKSCYGYCIRKCAENEKVHQGRVAKVQDIMPKLVEVWQKMRKNNKSLTKLTNIYLKENFKKGREVGP